MAEKIIKPYNFNQLEKIKPDNNNSNINLLNDVESKIDLSIGTSTLTISEMLNLKTGSLLKIENNNSKIEIDISVQGKIIGKGEVVLIDDEPYVRVIKINKK